MILSSSAATRVWCLGTSCGANVPARSRGTRSGTGPCSVCSVLALVPLRRLPVGGPSCLSLLSLSPYSLSLSSGGVPTCLSSPPGGVPACHIEHLERDCTRLNSGGPRTSALPAPRSIQCERRGLFDDPR